MLHCYLTFPSTYHAIRAEKLLNDEIFYFKMVPVPRAISSSCGIALRCSCQDAENAAEILRQYGVELEGIHTLEGKGSTLSSIYARKGKK